MNRRNFLSSAVALAVAPAVPAIAAPLVWMGVDFGVEDKLIRVQYVQESGPEGGPWTFELVEKWEYESVFRESQRIYADQCANAFSALARSKGN